eukprot:13251196-Alexandrium_andersonii.AAC.1
MRSLQSEVSALKQTAPAQPPASAQEAQSGSAPSKQGGKDRSRKQGREAKRAGENTLGTAVVK